MAEYIVYLNTTASTSIKVEADNREDAEEAVYRKDLPTLCAQCSGWGRDAGVELSDAWDVSEVTDANGNVVED